MGKKWYSFGPMGYVGLALVVAAIVSSLVFSLRTIFDDVIRWPVFIVGLYLMLRGRREYER